MLKCGVVLILIFMLIPVSGMRAESPSEKFETLDRKYRAAVQEFHRVYSGAKTDEERRAAMSSQPQPQEYGAQFLALAEGHAGNPVAVDALVWIVLNQWGGTELQKALDILARDHAQSTKLGPACAQLSQSPSPDSVQFLRAIMDRSPHSDVQREACFSLAKCLKDQSGNSYGKHDPPADEAEKLLEQVIEKYGDTHGTDARAELFELRNLIIGKEAPEIEGEDADGVAFKLSDYRGKVVMLDFWGDW